MPKPKTVNPNKVSSAIRREAFRSGLQEAINITHQVWSGWPGPVVKELGEPLKIAIIEELLDKMTDPAR